MKRSALVAGPTGLVGSAVLEQLLLDERCDRVIALTRRPLDRSSPILEQWSSGHGDLLSALRPERVDTVLCCLGTTIATAGSQAAFRHVDHELVIGLGRWAKANGVKVFCVVSAIGADASSRFFYNRVKGEMERDLKAIGLPLVHVFHPSILVGPRKEVRAGERIGVVLMELLAPLMVGNLARFHPMRHDILAQAMINAMESTVGDTHAYREIVRLAAS